MKCISLCVLIALLTCCGMEVHATHAMGAQLTYHYLDSVSPGNYRYEIEVCFYRNCDGISAPSATAIGADVSITNSFGYPAITPVFTQVANDLCENGSLSGSQGCVVNHLCSSFLPMNSCNTPPGPYPGAERYLYRSVVTLQSNCFYQIAFSESARNTNINNISGGGSASLYVECLINTAYPGNHSPKFLADPVLFGLFNMPFYGALGGYDAEGDSLVYENIPPMDDGAVPLNYISGYRLDSPMHSSIPFSFDRKTGNFNASPIGNNPEGIVLTTKISEYRNGVLLGSTIRDQQLELLQGSANDIVLDKLRPVKNCVVENGNVVHACTGDTIAFDLVAHDLSHSSLMVRTSFGVDSAYYPGLQIVVANTADQDTIHVVWNHFPGAPTPDLVIEVINTDCPVRWRRTFTVQFSGRGKISPATTVYCGQPVALSTAGSSAIWSSSGALSSTTGNVVYASPGVSSWYYCTSACGSDSVFIRHSPSVSFQNLNTLSFCGTPRAALHPIVTPSGDYHYEWQPAAAFFAPGTNNRGDTLASPEFEQGNKTAVTLRITDTAGCVSATTIALKPVVNYRVDLTADWQHGSAAAAGSVDVFTATVSGGMPGYCGPAANPFGVSQPSSLIEIGSNGSNEAGTSSMYPSPLGSNRKSARHQYLFRAAELQSMIGKNGAYLYSFSLEVANLNASNVLHNFTIKIGCTSADSLLGYEGNLFQVFDPKDVGPAASWNNFIFEHPYSWDGYSNLVVDICFENTTSGSSNNKMFKMNTPFRATYFTASNVSSQCGITGTQYGVLTLPNWAYTRPYARFSAVPYHLISNIPDSTLQYNWQPAAGPNTVQAISDSQATATPMSTQWYSVTISDSNFCGTATDSVLVTIDPAISLHIISAGVDLVVAQASIPNQTYDWYYFKSGGPAIHLSTTGDTIHVLRPDSGFYFVVRTLNNKKDTSNTVYVTFPSCTNPMITATAAGVNATQLCLSPQSSVNGWYFHNSITDSISLVGNNSCYVIGLFSHTGYFYANIVPTNPCTNDSIYGYEYSPPPLVSSDTTTSQTVVTVLPSDMHYSWIVVNFNGDTLHYGDSQSITLPDTFGGTVVVITTNPKTGQQDTSVINTISPRITGLEAIDAAAFYVFPNPARSGISIYTEDNTVKGRLLNGQGAVCREFSSVELPVVNVSQLPRGFYTIELKTEKHFFRRKIILE